MKRATLAFIILYLLMFGTACAGNSSPSATPTPTVLIITATLPPTQTSRPSPTTQPATATPPVSPAEGQTTSQLNVRSAPSAASDSLGMVNIFDKVQIVGKDPEENWWMILYPGSPNGTGWITAQFVQVSDVPDVPVIGEQAQPPVNPVDDTIAMATVIETVNVRSGPGTGYNAIGTVEAQETVSLTGKDPNGAWLQIVFPGGPGGKGWVSAAFLQAQGVESLPILTEAGQVIGTGTPGVPISGPTPTVVAAFPDGDSSQSPAVSITLSPTELRSFSFNSDLSSPEGDAEDWVQFTIAGQIGRPETVSVTTNCSGNSTLNLELIQNSIQLQSWRDLPCGQTSQLILSLFAGSPYSLHMLPSQDTNKLSYVNYSLIVTLR